MHYASFIVYDLSDISRNLIQTSGGIIIFAVKFPQNILQPFWLYTSHHKTWRIRFPALFFLSCQELSALCKIFIISFMTLQFPACVISSTICLFAESESFITSVRITFYFWHKMTLKLRNIAHVLTAHYKKWQKCNENWMILHHFLVSFTIVTYSNSIVWFSSLAKILFFPERL